MGLDQILALLQTALELGLISSLTVLALFLSYSMLNVCDLSTDGCFTLGAVVGAAVAISGHPYLSIPAAMLAGVASGFITAILQTKMGVNSLLAGIIVNTGLYSVNIAIMGGSSILNMNKADTVFTIVKYALAKINMSEQYKLAVAAAAVIIIAVLLGLFLKTRLGLAIRATGDNPDMVRASSINTAFTITLGLCISNSMTALSGAVLAQYQRTADINLGTGMVVIGLASLIIGETLFRRGGVGKKAVGALMGSIIYRFVIAVALRLDLPSECLKLISAVIVALAIAGPYVSRRLAEDRRRRAARQKGDR